MYTLNFLLREIKFKSLFETKKIFICYELDILWNISISLYK